MGQVLHRRATTTYAIRKQIQEHKADINSIAKKFNIDWTTAKKWKNRNSVEDQPMGNGRSNASLSLDQDWLICKVRQLTWLPLDDLAQILKPMLPKLSRSALHRCLQYYGISKKPKALSEKPKKSRFKS